MTAKRGTDLLLKVYSDETGTFVTIAGLRTRSLSFNATTVDVTNMDSQGQWRELLAGAGVKSAKLNGSGIFKDAPSDELARSCFFGGDIRDWQAVIPDFGVVSGPFQISSLEFSGKYDGEVTFEIAMESAGELTFSPI
jgi:TP901-1 family phage major tail protein